MSHLYYSAMFTFNSTLEMNGLQNKPHVVIIKVVKGDRGHSPLLCSKIIIKKRCVLLKDII